jgi:hypothetical protein
MFVQLSLDELSVRISLAFDKLKAGDEVICHGSEKSNGVLRDICSRELARLHSDHFYANRIGAKVVMISIADVRLLDDLILPPNS